MAVELERMFEVFLNSLGDAHGVAHVLEVLEQDRELVAAQPRDGMLPSHPRHRVHRPHAPLQTFGDRDQKPIADLVAEAVVDQLEPVEVEEQDGKRLAVTLAPFDRPCQAGPGTGSGSAGRSVDLRPYPR